MTYDQIMSMGIWQIDSGIYGREQLLSTGAWSTYILYGSGSGVQGEGLSLEGEEG